MIVDTNKMDRDIKIMRDFNSMAPNGILQLQWPESIDKVLHIDL